MKLALAFIFQAFDLPFLKLHLLVYLSSGVFDGVVGLCGDETPPTSVFFQLSKTPSSIAFRPFTDFNFGAQRNALIERCEMLGYDAVLVMDCDELMQPDQLHLVREALEEGYKALYFPRYNFIGDRQHYAPQWYPDPQLRAWRLNEGLRYTMTVHEVPNYQALGWRHGHELLTMNAVNIYHYSWLKSADECDYRTALYTALGSGTPLPKREDYHDRVLNIPRVPFVCAQPLDPLEIGIHAPFAEMGV